MQGQRILVVHRRSTLTELIKTRRDSKLSRLVRAGDPFVQGYVRAHEAHADSLRRIKAELTARGLRAAFRHHIDGMDLERYDLVITVGGDGTVLHTSHAVCDTPVLGVNSSPSTSVGFLTATSASMFGAVLDQVLRGELEPLALCRMEVSVNNSVVTSRVLNDVLFCHDCPASTTRYALELDGACEDQLSSGVWISTAAGSTAALWAAGGKPMLLRSKRLQFVVREPFPAGGADDRQRPVMTCGFIGQGSALTIRSKTAAARLYVDGPHREFAVGFGDTVRLCRSPKPLHLFVDPRKTRDFA